MLVTYDIYRRNSKTGIRDYLIQDFSSLSLNLNYKKRSKFSLKGKTISGKCPLKLGDCISIFRNQKVLFSGVVTELEVNCSDVAVNTISWTASGEDDTIIFDWRIILTDNDKSKKFGQLTFDNDVYDKIRDWAYVRMTHYIENCFKTDRTIKERTIAGATFPPTTSAEIVKGVTKDGTVEAKKELSSFRYRKLSEVLKEIGESYNLFARYEWSSVTGGKKFTIPKQVDRTNSIIISPQFGNVSKWSVTRKYPKYNAVWVCSGDYTETITLNKGTKDEKEKNIVTRKWVYAEDTESVKKYGRIENLVTKSDIRITDDDPDTKKKDETVTAEEVEEMLADEAIKLLQENSAKEKYSVTMVENEDMQFQKNWNCGDKVTVVIDNTKFTSTIESVEITFSDSEEKLKPTIGQEEEGMFGEIYELIFGLDKRLQSEEKK